MTFDDKFFKELNYTEKQITKFSEAAYRDLRIAKDSINADVKFRFSYDALIKLGISLIAYHKYKVSSRAGHHVKILEKIAEILDDKEAKNIGEKMRRARNTDLYEGGIFMSDKQAIEYCEFTRKLFKKSEEFFNKKLGRML